MYNNCNTTHTVVVGKYLQKFISRFSNKFSIATDLAFKNIFANEFRKKFAGKVILGILFYLAGCSDYKCNAIRLYLSIESESSILTGQKNLNSWVKETVERDSSSIARKC
jgi:hypothetical protein